MNLYERDYTCISSPEEHAEWKIAQSEQEIVEKLGKTSHSGNRSLFRKYPKASARHFEAIFPNHYLDVVESSECEPPQVHPTRRAFVSLLNTGEINERAILNHINESRALFYCRCNP